MDRAAIALAESLAASGQEPDAHDDAWQPFYDLADAVETALRATGDLTRSKAARFTHTDTVTAGRVLDYLVREQYAHTSGNGAWIHYHPGRSTR